MNIQEHAHCEICGKVVEVGERWCGKTCEEKHDENQAEKKKAMYKMVAIIGVVLAVFTLLRMGII